MKTNQTTPEASRSQANNETILKTLDNAELENLSGGGVLDYPLKIDGVKGESAESSTLNIEIKVKHHI
ncbi:MAG: hypothetical protein F6J95_019955 [Leptolyngbya sp. SIO1E4]|nr:hypothetical protein [Leptolyngbya sp. SIO1E4]